MTYALFIDDHHFGDFNSWTAALKEAEWLINNTQDLLDAQEIRIQSKENV